MFNGKKIDKLEDIIYGGKVYMYAPLQGNHYIGRSNDGLAHKVYILEKENSKLKALLNEVIDYVYKEEK